MIVFNSSAHGYGYKEPRKPIDPKNPTAEQPPRDSFRLKPGINNVPAKFEAVAKALIEKYPADLSEGGGVSGAVLAEKDQAITAKDKEISLLKKQITNLQRLLDGSQEAPPPPARRGQRPAAPAGEPAVAAGSEAPPAGA